MGNDNKCCYFNKNKISVERENEKVKNILIKYLF
jgi:hypothetical protein